jgi:hypothetical protein
MIVRVRVDVQAEPSDGMTGSYGNISFNEEASITGADFPTIAHVFSDTHALLETVKLSHAKPNFKK